MAVVNLTSPYDIESGKIARAQKYAEMLQQQAMEPSQTFSYNGIQAPIPKTAGLAKILQGLTGVYMQNKADEDTKKLGEDTRAEAGGLIGKMVDPNLPAIAAQNVSVPATDEERADMLKGIAGGSGASPLAANATFEAPGGTGFGGSAGLPARAKTPAEIYADVLSGLGNPYTSGFATAKLAQMATPERPKFQKVGEYERTGTVDPLTGKITFDDNGAPPSRPRTGDLGVYDEYARQMQASGKVPKTIEQFLTDQKIAGRPPAAETYGSPITALDENGNPVFIQAGKGGGPPSVLPGFKPPDVKLKPIPVSVTTAILDNEKSLAQIDRALALTSGSGTVGSKADPSATGFKGFLPDVILNRADPSGVEARAEIGDIGSMIIHDRSGAAVTASESPRLKPFIPLITDDAETLKKKLNRLKSEVTATHRGVLEFYSEDQGYKPLPARGGNVNVPREGTGGAQPNATAPEAPPVSTLKEGVYTTFPNAGGQVWTLRNGSPVQVK